MASALFARALARVRKRRLALVADWQRILKRAWSVRLMALCVAVIVLEPVLSAGASLALGHSAWWVPLVLSLLSGLFGAAAIVARVIAQKNVEEDINGQSSAEG